MSDARAIDPQHAARPGTGAFSFAGVRALLQSNGTLLVVAFVMAFLGYRLGEKIQHNNGMGWDGIIYGALARDFYHKVFEEGILTRHANRVLPSGVVYSLLRLLAFPLTEDNVRATFGLLNVGILALSAYLWGRLADLVGVSVRGKWLGFFALLVNFGMLKWTSYYPVLTDPWAFFLGLASLTCYLENRRLLLAALAFVGSFVWPTFLYHVFPLLAFPRQAAWEDETPAPNPRLAVALAAMVTAVVTAFVGVVLFAQVHYSPGSLSCGFLSYQPVSAVAVLALGMVAGYVFLGFRHLLDDPRFSPLAFVRRLHVWPVLLAVAVVVAVKLSVWALARHANHIPLRDCLVHLGWMSIRRPGLFFVAHVVYFGPAIVLAACHWPALCRVIRSYGPGLACCAAFNLLLAVDCETRHLVHFLPLVVLAVVLTVDGPGLTWRQVLTFAVVAVALSKCWYHLGGFPNAQQWETRSAQRLFMHLGPWVTRKAYLVQGAIVVALAGYVVLLARRNARLVSKTREQA